MASWTLASASSRVSPSLIHPGRAGTSTVNPPSSLGANTTRSFIAHSFKPSVQQRRLAQQSNAAALARRRIATKPHSGEADQSRKLPPARAAACSAHPLGTVAPHVPTFLRSSRCRTSRRSRASMSETRWAGCGIGRGASADSPCLRTASARPEASAARRTSCGTPARLGASTGPRSRLEGPARDRR